MRLVQPTKAPTFLLVILLSIPGPLFAQMLAQVYQTAKFRKPVHSDQIAAAIGDLLKERPFDASTSDEEATKPDGKEDQDKPPADDAPIEKLVAYWSTRGYSDFEEVAPKPSDKVRERLLEAFENRPWLPPGLTGLFPETSDVYDRLYKLLNEDTNEQANWKNIIRLKLKHESSYFRDELLSEVGNFGKFNYSDISSLRALVKLDWEAAKPFVEQMAGNSLPHVAAEAQVLLYEQASRTNDSSQIEALRAQLKVMVANRMTPVPARQAALDSLMKSEWSGQEEWYASLFADTSLSGVRLEEKKVNDKQRTDLKGGSNRVFRPQMMDEEAVQNSLWTPLLTNSAKLVPVVLNLVGNGDRAIHLAAVSCLTQFLAGRAGAKEQRTRVALALLPWLSQPDWGGTTDRWSFIESMANLDVPESVPGLIWVLDNDEMPENRATAASVLVKYKNPQAIPSLRRALGRDGEETLRQIIIVALAELGGFTDGEAANAIEAYARRFLTEDGEREINDALDGTSEKQLPLQISIGLVYAQSESVKISDGLAAVLFNRAKVLRKTQPELARKILSIAQQSNGIVADLNLVDCIAEGWVDLEAVKSALETRAQLRKNTGDKLEELFKQGGYQTGLAAVILADEDRFRSVLAGRDANAQLALLAAARYLREKLTVELVGKLIVANASLTAAAESYLEVEDSAEARKLIWARHPGEAKILGQQFSMIEGPPGRSMPLTGWEEKMRNEVRRPNGQDGPEEIYAIVPGFNPEVYNSIIVRVGKGQAEVRLQQAEGRRLTRMLTSDELQELKEFTSREEVENLKPESRFESQVYHGPAMQFEYLRLNKDGGRRIMVAAPRRAPKNDATLHEQLSGLFYRLSRSGEFKLRYSLEDKIPGVEVLVAEDKRQVFSICQEAGQLRVMVSVENPNPNIAPEKSFEWRSLVGGQLGAPVDEPANCQSGNLLWSQTEWMRDLRMKAGAMFDPRARLGNVWFAQASMENDPGIWKFEEGKSPAKIVAGIFGNLIPTPDGKWLIAKKTIQTNDNYENRLVRIHLPTGREYPVGVTGSPDLIPLSFITAHNKLLLSQQQFQYRPESSVGNFFLLDAETGQTQPVKGEFRPLINAYARPLQPTDKLAEKPNEFWAALYDAKKKVTVVGRYDTRTFGFAPVVELPEIRLNSADTWADAAAGKLYFVYLGHLLRVPLAK